MLCVAIFFYVFLRILGTFKHSLAATVVTVDKQKEISGFKGNLGALVIACWCANSTDSVAINWQILNIQHTSTDTFVWFARTSDTENKVALDFVQIKSADAVSCIDARKVNQVGKGVNFV